MADPDVSIVIVSYNGRALLERCLPAVLEQADAHGAEVVVVDNASVDGSVAYLHEAFPQVRVVPSTRNEGFAEGCNVGVRAVRGDRIVLLNNDAVPRPGWLAELLRPLETPEVAISCSVIHEERYAADYALGTGSISVIGHPIPNVGRDVTEPFYATGCSLAFKRDRLGDPFDPLYFAYYEDTLLSWRARLAGYRVVRTLASGVDHLGSVTADRQPGLMLYYWERNKLLTMALCYETGTLARLVPLYLFDAVARVLEDAWLQLKRPRPREPAAVLTRYAAAARALAWIAGHTDLVRQHRSSIQAQRTVPDSRITPRLSGKVFDDLVPTRGHRLANALAVAYCRLVGIRTAESEPGRDADQARIAAEV